MLTGERFRGRIDMRWIRWRALSLTDNRLCPGSRTILKDGQAIAWTIALWAAQVYHSTRQPINRLFYTNVPNTRPHAKCNKRNEKGWADTNGCTQNSKALVKQEATKRLSARQEVLAANLSEEYFFSICISKDIDIHFRVSKSQLSYAQFKRTPVN